MKNLEGRVQGEGQERTVYTVGAEGNRQPQGSTKKRPAQLWSQVDPDLNPGAWRIQAK